MIVRRATLEDARSVADVFIPSLESLTFLPTLHTHDEHRAFVRDRIADSEAWLAEEDGRVVGMAILSGDVLEQFYVHPDEQGRGAGSALLDKVKEVRPEGFTFWVFQQNEQARRFYERRGCRLVRLTDGAGNEQKTPDALYEF